MRSAVAVVAALALVGIAAPGAARAGPVGHSERLAARARRGDRVARAALVDEHMGIVRSLAFRYSGLGLPVEDLVQEGAIGLLTAVDEYDSSRGASFSTYAFWRVRAAITHAVTARANLVRIPRRLLERRRALAADQAAEAPAPPSVVSLDSPLADGTSLVDRLADDPASRPDALAVTALERHALRTGLQRLRPPLQTILERHFGIDRDPETLTEIAADLRLSPERTRALKNEALHELASDLAQVA